MTDRKATSLGTRLAALLSGVRLGQYASVGAVGAVFDNAALYALVEFGDVGPLLAKVIAWEVAILVIFVVNERWTFARFGAAGLRPLAERFLQSNLVRTGGFVVTMLVYGGLVGVGVWYIAANVVGILAGSLVNYAFESLYIWKVHRTHR